MGSWDSTTVAKVVDEGMDAFDRLRQRLLAFSSTSFSPFPVEEEEEEKEENTDHTAQVTSDKQSVVPPAVPPAASRPIVATHVRPAYWRSSADELNHRSPPCGLFNRLVHEEMSTVNPSMAQQQIDRDLARTFCVVRGLRVPQEEAMHKLRAVLVAYAAYNPQIGYCQGMNQLAAILLLVVDEESAFWCLTALVECVFVGYFSESMEMAHIDQEVLSDLLMERDPELSAHLLALDAPPSIVTIQWLLTGFVNSALPLEALLRVWDRLFSPSERHLTFLFRIAAALLMRHRENLLAARELDDIMPVYFTMGAELTDADDVEQLLDAAEALRSASVLQPQRFHSLRMQHAAKLGEQRQQDASLVVQSHINTAKAIAAEMASPPLFEPSSSAQAPHPLGPAPDGVTGTASSGWTLISAAEASADGDVDGWDVVQPPLPHQTPSKGCSLSFVVHQLQVPLIHDEHFRPSEKRGEGGSVARSSAERQ